MGAILLLIFLFFAQWAFYLLVLFAAHGMGLGVLWTAALIVVASFVFSALQR